MKAALLALPSVRALASEEDDEAVLNSCSNGDGFAVVFDPLDGSRNIEVSIPTGTIFGIYRCAAGTPRVNCVTWPALDTIRFAAIDCVTTLFAYRVPWTGAPVPLAATSALQNSL